MTPAQAREIYSFSRDPDHWHTQPVCECGDYVSNHADEPPHPCAWRATGGPGSACRCYAYRERKARPYGPGDGDRGDVIVLPVARGDGDA